jgi:hypothetical protein
MAHFAEIDQNNIVVRVLVVANENETNGQDYLANQLNLGGTWIQTSYNTRGGIHLNGGVALRKNFAGVGFFYDPIRDAFIAPQPYPSWVLDDETCQWKAPVPHPADGVFYLWNEELLTWEPSQ